MTLSSSPKSEKNMTLLVFLSASLQAARCFIIFSKAHYLHTLQVIIKPKSVNTTHHYLCMNRNSPAQQPLSQTPKKWYLTPLMVAPLVIITQKNRQQIKYITKILIFSAQR